MATRTRTRKPTAASIRAFTKATEEVLVRLGAVRTGSDSHRQEWQIETTLGLLTVTPIDSWLACRFEDVARAKAHMVPSSDTRLNPHSGKWNWMSGMDDLPWFEAAVRRLLAEDKSA